MDVIIVILFLLLVVVAACHASFQLLVGMVTLLVGIVRALLLLWVVVFDIVDLLHVELLHVDVVVGHVSLIH